MNTTGAPDSKRQLRRERRAADADSRKLSHGVDAPAEPPRALTLDVYNAVHSEWCQSSASDRGSLRNLLYFWWDHAWVPLIVFLVSASTFAVTSSDLKIARALFFDPSTGRWIGADSWWVNEVVHTGGRWFMIFIGAAALLLWMVAHCNRRLGRLRRPTAYFLVAAILSVGIIGLLKQLTNVDCPWDLQEFGGRYPFVELFGDRPDDLRPGHCFPAAHASAGYTLLCLYFVSREHHRWLAYLGLGAGIATGLLYGIAQQSRGAHFASHDLWSAFLVWMISLTTYTFAFKMHVWDSHSSADRELPAPARPDAAS